MGFLRLRLQSSTSTNSPPFAFGSSLLSSLSRGGAIHPMYTTFRYKTDPADVALVSPQTPLIPLFYPHLSGGCRRRHSYKAPLLAGLQWVFCVFTCNHPPQQTHHPSPLALPSSQAFREEGPFKRYIRLFRSDTRPAPTEIKPHKRRHRDLWKRFIRYIRCYMPDVRPDPADSK